jgi:hypothetical protein
LREREINRIKLITFYGEAASRETLDKAKPTWFLATYIHAMLVQYLLVLVKEMEGSHFDRQASSCLPHSHFCWQPAPATKSQIPLPLYAAHHLATALAQQQTEKKALICLEAGAHLQ